MSLTAPAYAIKLVKQAEWNPCGVGYRAITLSGGQIDLTDPEGVTGGYSARAVKIGSTAGNLVCIDLTGTETTIPVAANETVSIGMCVIGGSGAGTSATPIGVIL